MLRREAREIDLKFGLFFLFRITHLVDDAGIQVEEIVHAHEIALEHNTVLVVELEVEGLTTIHRRGHQLVVLRRFVSLAGALCALSVCHRAPDACRVFEQRPPFRRRLDESLSHRRRFGVDIEVGVADQPASTP